MGQLSSTHVVQFSVSYCRGPVVLSACCARLPELLPCASCPVCMMCQSLSATTTYVLVVLYKFCTCLPQQLSCASCPLHVLHMFPSATAMCQLSTTHVAHVSLSYCCHVPVVLSTCCLSLSHLLPCTSCPLLM
jgi:hypothetical protein